ncbi:unnamed protein product [Ambrosiozyma monospora]|uniref:Unnamed protein product n=1 Tax=Ambrosiozyma monospora TaxID=43982 RepID=A0A9W6YYP1_AMBMO|nr:unnamed protein product [Ambrosiozyma monospora]
MIQSHQQPTAPQSSMDVDLERQTSLQSSIDSKHYQQHETKVHHSPHHLYESDMSKPHPTTTTGSQTMNTNTNNSYYHDDLTKPSNMSMDQVSRIATSHDGTIIYLGGNKFYKDELIHAFGGTMNPDDWYKPSEHKFANPAPLGLSAFALTTFVLSLINAGAMGVKNDSVVVGLAMFYGGLIQLLSGMWEMSVENTFGALALSSFGGFWMSFATISIPWFNIAASYDDPTELDNAVGFYLIGWTIFTAMLVLCTMKSTLAFCSLFVFLTLTFLCLALGKLCPSHNCTVAGGVLGVITSFISWYNAYAGVANEHNSYITVTAFPLPKFGNKHE